MLTYVEFNSMVLEKKIFFKNAPPCSTVSRYYLFCKKNVFFISAIYLHLTIRMLCATFGLNWPGGFREEVRNVKVCRRTDRRMDRRADGRRPKCDQVSK